MSTPNAARLRDGRLHLQHGPIDLVIEAFGAPHEVEAAYAQAFARFGDVLTGLVAELPTLRQPVGAAHPLLRGPVDKRARIDVFEPQPPVLAALSARLKAQFDPKSILNPGRMVREANF